MKLIMKKKIQGNISTLQQTYLFISFVLLFFTALGERQSEISHTYAKLSWLPICKPRWASVAWPGLTKWGKRLRDTAEPGEWRKTGLLTRNSTITSSQRKESHQVWGQKRASGASLPSQELLAGLFKAQPGERYIPLLTGWTSPLPCIKHGAIHAWCHWTLGVSEEVSILIFCSPDNLCDLSDFLCSSTYRSAAKALSFPFLIMLLSFSLTVNEPNGTRTIMLFGFLCRLNNRERKGWLCNIYVPVPGRGSSCCKWSHLARSFGSSVGGSLPWGD